MSLHVLLFMWLYYFVHQELSGEFSTLQRWQGKGALEEMGLSVLLRPSNAGSSNSVSLTCGLLMHLQERQKPGAAAGLWRWMEKGGKRQDTTCFRCLSDKDGGSINRLRGQILFFLARCTHPWHMYMAGGKGKKPVKGKEPSSPKPKLFQTTTAVNMERDNSERQNTSPNCSALMEGFVGINGHNIWIVGWSSPPSLLPLDCPRTCNTVC